MSKAIWPLRMVFYLGLLFGGISSLSFSWGGIGPVFGQVVFAYIPVSLLFLPMELATSVPGQCRLFGVTLPLAASGLAACGVVLTTIGLMSGKSVIAQIGIFCILCSLETLLRHWELRSG